MEPAAIRYKNPGAMWGRTGRRPSSSKIVPTNAPIPLKWGSVETVYLSDGTGQGNNIAVFNTWVQGVCAQLDLWRTSPKYRNKRFADAIHTWSGGNDVPAYIRYVKARIPGMDEDTIMNDTFWMSPNGIKFLKAQSGHEAGKPMPIPDAVWKQAQEIVFAKQPKVIVASAPINVQPERAPINLTLKALQAKLIDPLNYHEIGDDDGRWGGKTRGAITAFLNDRGKSPDGLTNEQGFTSEAAGDAVEDEVDQAIAESWSRPIAPKRANATVKEIAEKNDVVRLTLWQRFTAKIGAWFVGLGLGGSGITTIYDYVTDHVSTAREWFVSIPPEAWLVIIAILVGVIYYTTRQALKAAGEDYNKGKIN